jgi:DNA-directed RNA polymerase specialized sigma24 family protein
MLSTVNDIYHIVYRYTGLCNVCGYNDLRQEILKKIIIKFSTRSRRATEAGKHCTSMSNRWLKDYKDVSRENNLIAVLDLHQ